MDSDRDSLLGGAHIINAAEPDVYQNGQVPTFEDESSTCCGKCFSKSSTEETNIVTQSYDGSEEFKVYKRRWYILAVFSMMAFTQGWGWNTWGPIGASSKYAFGWTNTTISILASWGPIMFMLSVFGFSYMMQHKGLRWACLTSSFCVLAGAGVRCVSTTPPLVTWLMNIGQIGYSLGGPVSMAGASVLSACWFPPNQRFTATAMMSRIMAIGGTSTFIWGPRLVRDVTGLNMTEVNHTLEVAEIREDIHRYMFIELGVAAVIFLAILIYFPSKPPTPPSLSTASIENVDFKSGFKQILRHKQFWLLGIPYAMSYGVYIGWSANLDEDLQSLNITQVSVGWLAFIGNIIGSFFALAMALLIDRLAGHMKPVLLVMYIGGAAGSLVFALTCMLYAGKSSTDPPSQELIYLLYGSRIIGAICISGLPPLVFEVLCETTYPIPTTVNNGVLTFVKNFCVLIFLVVLMVPGIGTSWMNWFMFASATICIPMVIIFKGQNNRIALDKQKLNINVEDDEEIKT